MDLWVIGLFILGFALIIKGGDWFVEAAVWIAEITGIPKIIIGATIVSLATTLPELLVSLFAVIGGSTGLGVGNAIGSIICNTGLILSIALIISPPKVERKIFLSKALILSLAVITLALIAKDGTISKIDSICLFLILIAYIIFNIRALKTKNIGEVYEDQTEIRHIDTSRKSIVLNIIKFVLGATGIVIGARLLVDNGVIIAAFFGVSDAVIGLTVVALGTSLPELVTTITSLVKKHGAMGIGNIIGANILNIALVLSTCAVSSNDGIILTKEVLFNSLSGYRTLAIDIPVVALMLAVLILPVIFTKNKKLKRLQGVFLILIYIGFITFTAINI
jgi:cation:H+ antiporter